MFKSAQKIVSEKDYHFSLLQENYLVRRNHDIGVFRKANSEKDFALIAGMAHQIIGNSAMYGFDKLGFFGESLLKYSKSEDQNLIEETIVKMNHYLDTLEC